MRSDTMIGPGEHENSALAKLQGGPGTAAEAQVFATLALAAAVNRLADSHEALANAVAQVAYNPPFRVDADIHQRGPVG